MTDLLPCPFCGGKAILEDSTQDFRVLCTNCDAESDPRPDYEVDRTRIQAIKQWNTRPQYDKAESIRNIIKNKLGDFYTGDDVYHVGKGDVEEMVQEIDALSNDIYGKTSYDYLEQLSNCHNLINKQAEILIALDRIWSEGGLNPDSKSPDGNVYINNEFSKLWKEARAVIAKAVA